MSTKFFTNSGENTLLNKFDGIFKYTKVHAFDALVGYFRSSGYFRIRQYLENVSEIRILVGIDVDHLISEAAKKGLEFNFNTDITRDEYLKDVKNDIQESAYSKEVEVGILQFINDIITGKIRIKAHPDKNIHAKIYIFTPEIWNEHNSGSVITGSSNLSISGIEKNFEFNVELRDYDDVAFAKVTFENLWNEAIDILPSSIESLRTSTYLNDTFTPFELYIKLLVDYFGKSIDYDPESITDLPKGYKKLAYQIDAVNDGFNKLMQHDGFILADVVGLGKTIVATIIAKKFYFSNGYRTKTLIIFPPAMEKSWRNTIHDFEIPNVDYITNGSIHKIKHADDYDLIIVDEAHKFRSDESEMFNQLQKLCKTDRKRPGIDGSTKKKVILVTATPLNNHPEDIRNQLYLFQNAKQSTLEVGNLQHFFRPLIEKYNRLKKERDHVKIGQGVKEIYEEIRVKILEPIIVRRTRTDIKNTPAYWNDIIDQGLKFPDIVPPKQILYQLDEKLNDLYDNTVHIVKDTRSGLGYYRYQAIKFLTPDAKAQYKKIAQIDENQATRISEQLAHIMRILLVKRIDSSFHAFKMSLKRYHDANLAMVKMIEKNRVFIAPKLNVSEYILNEDEQTLERLLIDSENEALVQAFTKEDFAEEFIAGIHNDQLILSKLVAEWGLIENDPKYDTFIEKIKTELLNTEINPNRKIIVFSESKETTDYIAKRLRADKIEKVLAVDSGNQKDLADVIYENFDANVPVMNQKSEYDIVITTEVLAEGVNLHRSNFILNYDIPWNATRLMQRIGRVNRIGTTSDKIFIYNFFPTVQTDNEIELNKKAYMKLQAFHSALGEDSQIYSNQEEYDSFGLFDQIPEEEKDERLEYLNFLRKFRSENPNVYKYIKNKIPARSRTCRKNRSSKGQTIAFIKNKKRDSFYLIFQDLKLDELTFVEAARIFKAEISERSVPLHDLHYDQINVALKSFQDFQSLRNLGDKASVKLGPNEQRAMGFISKFIASDLGSDNENELMEAAKSAIRKGKFQKLHREIVQLIKNERKAGTKLTTAFNLLINILKSYPLLQSMDEDQNTPIEKAKPRPAIETLSDIPRIIISESFTH